MFILKKLLELFKPNRAIPINWRPKQVISVGDISQLIIPDSLPYGGALKKIRTELVNSGLMIELDSFYTQSPIKLHNHFNELTYNFVSVDGKNVIAYEIQWRKVEGSTYYEVDYDGNVIFQCKTFGCDKSSPHFEEYVRNMQRIFSTIGEYQRFTELGK
ncbi:hypothetical protein N473_08665 [Pseudoalteromonas luteoviolacea CPMOR-1]|uniref:Uncharacterized protein n=1 Tax=Pseudoalteromonas luteoviolacea CPMOR-1 TaxID=1365248 RepID=A0A167MI65_9GAMM|nr:hypothetical protein N473_08665 [Pseudoalteromonas luteoviolacea CPMOR-1]